VLTVKNRETWKRLWLQIAKLRRPSFKKFKALCPKRLPWSPGCPNINGESWRIAKLGLTSLQQLKVLSPVSPAPRPSACPWRLWGVLIVLNSFGTIILIFLPKPILLYFIFKKNCSVQRRNLRERPGYGKLTRDESQELRDSEGGVELQDCQARADWKAEQRCELLDLNISKP
jgi:hypothetical protein